VKFGASEDLMKMFLSTVVKKKNVPFRNELKEQMMDVTLREEP
jgi:hypothetical protein